LKYLNTKK